MSDAMEGLRVRFLDRCADDLARINDLLERDLLDGEEMPGLVHRLAGAAGTFGFPDISVAAGECDDAFARGEVPDRAKVQRLAATMREALAR